MTWPDAAYIEKLVSYLRSLAASSPGDIEVACHLRLAEELAQLSREPGCNGGALRSLVQRMEETRSAGASWGSGMQEVYVAARALARRAT